MEKLKCYVISHTHWDREWYQSFQNYRYRLVRFMDNLIESLEKDEEFKVFHLDGQTIVLEDYLEIRPERKARLTKLIQAGRIVIGPWYVMPDEFLVSGESLIKNMQIGHEISGQYGVEPMKNGYVTDIFGHNSQFPQILNGFEIHSATLYRGIGDYEKDAFCWKSPDGSEVTAAKLEAERSYSNFYFAVRWPYEENGFDEADAVERMKVLAERARRMAATDAVLMMDGVDHGGLEPDIPKMLRLFEKEIPDVEFIHANIEEYFERIDKKALETIEGSLYHVARRGINNQVLKNVLSSMVHIKQENDKCETYLTTVSEPLNAFCEMKKSSLKNYRRDDYSLAPRRNYLDTAWKTLITNHPHDSICGCSLSDVHRDNEYRYRQAQQMAEIAAEDCVKVLTRNIRCTGGHDEAVLFYNPSGEPVQGVHVFTLPVTKAEYANRRFYDSENRLLDVQIIEEQEELYANNRLLQLVRFETLSYLKVAAEITIPAFGYTVIYCDNLKNVFRPDKKQYKAEVYYPPKRLAGKQKCGHDRIDNGKLVVELNGKGLLNVTVKETGRTMRDFHLLENRSDVGDGWNWRPAVYDSIVYGENCLSQFSVLSDGPLCTVWKLVYELKVPRKAAPGLRKRSEEVHTQQVTTVMTLPRNSEVLYFETKVENTTENNRLRVMFPTGLHEEKFYTKTPFDFAEWTVTGEDNTDAIELDTLVHPSQGITKIGFGKEAVSLYSKGLYEVEVTDDEEQSLALTLFRAPYKENETLQPRDIKMKREMIFEYALSFAEESATETLRKGEQYRTGIKEFRFEQNPQAENLESAASFLTLSECEKIVSHISEKDGKLYLRLYDVSGKEEKVKVRFSCPVEKAEYVNLKGEALSSAVTNGQEVEITCPPHKIVTVRIDPA